MAANRLSPDSILNADAFDRDALMLVDAAGVILSKNATAEQLLTTGSPLKAVAGALTASRPEDAAELGRLLALANASDERVRTGGSIRLSRPVGGSLSITVSPIRSRALDVFSTAGAALVCVAAPSISPPAEILRRRFGLTGGEARLALALLGGSTLDSIASRSGVSRHTVRAQLGSIFAKTGSHRQAELVLLLSSTLGR